MLFLIVLLTFGLALWVASLVWNVRNTRGVLSLSAAMDFPLRERPRVSILIPARNEAAILSETLPRFLAQDYDNYEVILADDASSDATPELARRYARRFPERLRVVRVEALPPGWVGKPYALHQAFEAAQGEWVLATDADIVFHPRAIEAGLWLAERRQADLVSIYAFLECVSFWEKVMLPGFGLTLLTFFPLRKINDPASTVALASGGYILMRRRVWAELGGYEAIRSEMIDDLNTARLVKHSGHRIVVAPTKDLLRTRMYRNFRDLWEGLRKNAFAGHRFRVARLLAGVCGAWLTSLLPLVCIFYFGWRWAAGGDLGSGPAAAVLALSVSQYLLSAGLHLPVVAYCRIGLGYALLAPLGAVLYSIIALDSMARTLLGKGVSWKLRHYGKPSLDPPSLDSASLDSPKLDSKD